MAVISLQYLQNPEATLVSNQFIDRFMPQANGEFVKVYLYLLRIFGEHPVSFDPEEMADHLMCTGKDIFRALKYWEKQGLLQLGCSTDKITSVILLPLPEAAKSVPAAPAAAPEKKVREEKKSAAAAYESLSPERVCELKQNEEISQLLLIAEQYLGHQLNVTDAQKLLYYYDVLHFTPDLIEYLLEYCVERGKKSMRYIEKVALSWAEKGISTREQARAESMPYQKEYLLIMKCYGTASRLPTQAETELMDKWLHVWSMPLELVLEACKRTILSTGQAALPYTDRIIEDWYKKKAQTLNDVQKLDEEHAERKKRTAAPKAPAAPNRFNNFDQRTYDYKEYEKLLLNQSN